MFASRVLNLQVGADFNSEITWKYSESFGIIWIPNSSKSFGRNVLGTIWNSFGKAFGTHSESFGNFQIGLRKFSFDKFLDLEKLQEILHL